jgi:hypothetical protein
MRHEPAEIDEMTASRMERRLRTGARPNLTIGYERAWDVLTSVGPCTAPLHSRVLRVSSTTYFSLPNYALRERTTRSGTRRYNEYHGIVCSANSLALVF